MSDSARAAIERTYAHHVEHPDETTCANAEEYITELKCEVDDYGSTVARLTAENAALHEKLGRSRHVIGKLGMAAMDAAKTITDAVGELLEEKDALEEEDPCTS